MLPFLTLETAPRGSYCVSVVAEEGVLGSRVQSVANTGSDALHRRGSFDTPIIIVEAIPSPLFPGEKTEETTGAVQ